jgi:hypothetical protein
MPNVTLLTSLKLAGADSYFSGIVNRIAATLFPCNGPSPNRPYRISLIAYMAHSVAFLPQSTNRMLPFYPVYLIYARLW